MKNLLLVLSAFLIIGTATAQNKKATTTVAPVEETIVSSNEVSEKSPKMIFTETTYDFGKTKQGNVLEHEFEFKNEGNAPLIISGARSTCGCTVPVYPKEPIMPGETGIISVKFNTKGKRGNQKKPINVTHNGTPNKTTAYITAQIDAPKPAKKPIKKSSAKPTHNHKH